MSDQVDPYSAEALLRPHVLAMRGYTPGEQVNNCLKLNTNECAWPPAPSVMQALSGAPDDALRLYPDPLAQALRSEAAGLWGHPASGIVAGNGSDDCLTIIYRAVLAAGDEVLVPWPTYGLYDTLAAIQNVTIRHLDWGPGWSLPASEIIAAQPRLTLIANPNNPSGSLVSVTGLCELASQLSGVLVVDEAYIDYANGDASCIPHLIHHPNMMVLRTCSKSYALAGARLGFCLGNPRLVEHFLKVKDSYNVNALTQIVGRAALSDQAYHQQLVADTLAARRELEHGLAELGFSWVPSQANFLLTHMGPQAESYYHSLKSQGILVRWWDRDELRQYLRITVGQPADQQRLLAALGELTQ